MNHTLIPGSTPLLISLPHSSSAIPWDLAARMHPYAQGCPDTDWLLQPLYDFARGLGAGLLLPHWSRYVIDLNRSPANENLYPGADSTELCPSSTFERRPIYLPGQAPDTAEVQQRLATYWQPYHRALQAEAERLKTAHGHAIIFEAHSIASVVPRFFDGRLPDLNLGTADGKSCSPALTAALESVLAGSTYSWVVNGRFKGGYITRAYGQPAEGMHTVQLELSQATYLDEDSGAWLPGKVARIQPVLERLLSACLNTAL